MKYTGERMVPEAAGADVFWEHIYRYRFAATKVAGKRILDIASGEGYGIAALAQAGASTALGVDVSAEACAHAMRKYGIEARVGDAQKIPVKNQSIDLVVSFETIEHLSEPELFVEECARVLAPGGKAIISTPNRDVYREKSPNNPFHVNELSESEFSQLLAAKFSKIVMYTQSPKSAAWWSPRVLASDRSNWHKVRGFGRIRNFVQNRCCPELTDQLALERFRQNPVEAILARQSRLRNVANPFAVRPQRALLRETAVYLIAVVSL
jgi:ubiquinone/menaquinone biosynthesis C-methylase UbiE